MYAVLTILQLQGTLVSYKEKLGYTGIPLLIAYEELVYFGSNTTIGLLRVQ